MQRLPMPDNPDINTDEFEKQVREVQVRFAADILGGLPPGDYPLDVAHLDQTVAAILAAHQAAVREALEQMIEHTVVFNSGKNIWSQGVKDARQAMRAELKRLEQE